MISNKKSLHNKFKREKILDMITLMQGAVNSSKYLHLYLNVKKEHLNKLLMSLPSLKNPTVCNLSEKNWYGINTIILKKDFYKLIEMKILKI